MHWLKLVCSRRTSSSTVLGHHQGRDWSPCRQKQHPPPYTPGLLDLPCVNEVELRELRNIGYNISSESPRWAEYLADPELFQPYSSDKDHDIGPDSPFPQSLLGHGCLYLVDYWISSNVHYVADALLGNVSTTLPWLLKGPTVSPDELYRIGIWNQAVRGETGPILLYNQSRVDFESISTTLSHVATHMTTLLRQTGHVNHSAPAAGTEFHYATCLNVHWVWIILPSVAAGCVVALLIIVVLLTARDGTPIWKGDVLALIFHGPGGAVWSGNMAVSDEDGDVDKVLWELNTSQGMERRARGIKIRLDRDSDLVQLLGG
jgi:hypothetical protein